MGRRYLRRGSRYRLDDPPSKFHMEMLMLTVEICFRYPIQRFPGPLRLDNLCSLFSLPISFSCHPTPSLPTHPLLLYQHHLLIHPHTRKARWSTRQDSSLKLCIPCGTSTSCIHAQTSSSALEPASSATARRVEARSSRQFFYSRKAGAGRWAFLRAEWVITVAT